MMEENAQYWAQLLALFEQAVNDNNVDKLLRLLLTKDEATAISIRVQIVKLLLSGEMNQRELKDKLGTGIATITRGSNGLKETTPEFRAWLIQHLQQKQENVPQS